MAKKKPKAVIGDEITYKDPYSKDGFSSGKVINRLDQTILILEVIENGMIRHKLVDESQVITLNENKE